MAAETATIRVTRRTRDQLAARARERGISLAAMLAELASEAERQSALRSERAASRADGGERVAVAEEREWEVLLGEGVD